MRMILIGAAFVGVLMASGSAFAADNIDRAASDAIDRTASMPAAQPIVAVANADKAHVLRDTDFQFSQQERILITFLQLKREAERRIH